MNTIYPASKYPAKRVGDKYEPMQPKQARSSYTSDRKAIKALDIAARKHEGKLPRWMSRNGKMHHKMDCQRNTDRRNRGYEFISNFLARGIQ